MLITAFFRLQVNHSQRARDTPLKTWFLAENDGTVITAHCDCMALLFATSYEASKRISTTCTQEKSQWLPPTYVKEIPYVPVSEMNFQSSKKKHKQLIEHNVQPTALRSTQPLQEAHNITTEEEKLEFFRNISNSSSKPAVLSLIDPFNDKYVPIETMLPESLPEKFFKEQNTHLDYGEENLDYG